MITSRRHWNSLPLRALRVLHDEGPKTFAKKSVAALHERMFPPTYGRWISQYDTLTEKTRRRIRADMARWPVRPLISVIMPVYNTDPRWLARRHSLGASAALSNWELCISDDASTLAGMQDMLSDFARRDPRIRVFLRDQQWKHFGQLEQCAVAGIRRVRRLDGFGRRAATSTRCIGWPRRSSNIPMSI